MNMREKFICMLKLTQLRFACNESEVIRGGMLRDS